MLIIVVVSCHIGALLASAPFTPGVPPGGEASWAMGEQWKGREESEEKGAGRGVSRGAVSVCVCVCGKGIRIRSDFFKNLSSPDDGKLHIRIAACRLHCVLCSTPRAS
jgi:hypothetical protein